MGESVSEERAHADDTSVTDAAASDGSDEIVLTVVDGDAHAGAEFVAPEPRRRLIPRH